MDQQPLDRPSSPHSSSQMTILTVLIAVLVTAVLVGGGVYIWQKKESQKIQNSLQQQIYSLQEQSKQSGSNVSPPTSKPETEVKAYHYDNPLLSFSYPASWGEVQVVSNSEDGLGYDKRLTFTNMNWQAKFANVFIGFKAYDSNSHTQTFCDEGSCSKIDLLQEKRQVEKNSNVTIAGYKGEMQDSYYVPGGNFDRTYTFFTDTYKIVIVGSYDAFRIYGKEYEKERLLNPYIGMNRIVEEDLGVDFSKTANTNINLEVLLNKHSKDETAELEKLYQQLEELVVSFSEK